MISVHGQSAGTPSDSGQRPHTTRHPDAAVAAATAESSAVFPMPGSPATRADGWPPAVSCASRRDCSAVRPMRSGGTGVAEPEGAAAAGQTRAGARGPGTEGAGATSAEAADAEGADAEGADAAASRSDRGLAWVCHLVCEVWYGGRGEGRRPFSGRSPPGGPAAERGRRESASRAPGAEEARYPWSESVVLTR